MKTVPGAWLITEGAAVQMATAILAWYENWDNCYDGEPLKDGESELIAVARKLRGE